MNCPTGMVVDHINHNTLDNRKSNLRVCTYSQNHINSASRGGTSKYKGVFLYKKGTRKERWRAMAYCGKPYFLGYFDTEDEAGIAYNNKVKELFGEYAYLNKIEEIKL